jgi:hypothetical protein
MMKIDMSPATIDLRLKQVSQLRRTCLSLANIKHQFKDYKGNTPPSNRSNGPRSRLVANFFCRPSKTAWN